MYTCVSWSLFFTFFLSAVSLLLKSILDFQNSLKFPQTCPEALVNAVSSAHTLLFGSCFWWTQIGSLGQG